MTQKDNDLLLRDLCARVPYHPKGYVVNACNGAMCNEWLTCATFPMFTNIKNNCRLYLRPMSSMTEEETKIYHSLQDTANSYHYEFGDIVDDFLYFDNEASLDYLNSIHIDYRDLIEKGLALEAPEGMYDLDNK